jgi:rubrerythrin
LKQQQSPQQSIWKKRPSKFIQHKQKPLHDPNEKKLFNWLADWEKGHLKILNDLDNDLKEKIWYDNQFWPF